MDSNITAHAHPIDPETHALQKTGLAEPPSPEQLRRAGGVEPADPEHRLQDILPQIKDFAQKVGGLKKLAEIVQTLDQVKE
jgi:hypothetical protein